MHSIWMWLTESSWLPVKTPLRADAVINVWATQPHPYWSDSSQLSLNPVWLIAGTPSFHFDWRKRNDSWKTKCTYHPGVNKYFHSLTLQDFWQVPSLATFHLSFCLTDFAQQCVFQFNNFVGWQQSLVVTTAFLGSMIILKQLRALSGTLLSLCSR